MPSTIPLRDPDPVRRLLKLYDNKAPWMEKAACRYHPKPWLWFPARTPVKAVTDTCAGCKVRDECLDYAIVRNERFGIWGGLMTTERDDIVSRARREGRVPPFRPGRRAKPERFLR